MLYKEKASLDAPIQTPKLDGPLSSSSREVDSIRALPKRCSRVPRKTSTVRVVTLKRLPLV